MHASPIGPVHDVAHRSCVRPLFRAVKFLVGGVVLSAIAILLVVSAILGFAKGEVGLALGLVGGSCLLALIGVLPFRSGVYCWRVAFDPRWYFRVGPGGISACVPEEESLSSYKAQAYDFRWDDLASVAIHNWEYDERAIGAPNPFQFETKNGSKIVIETYYFAEDTLQIVKNIRAILGEDSELLKKQA